MKYFTLISHVPRPKFIYEINALYRHVVSHILYRIMFPGRGIRKKAMLVMTNNNQIVQLCRELHLERHAFHPFVPDVRGPIARGMRPSIKFS